jgi:hypothetical protein
VKATKAQIEARLTELLRIRLDGAEFWDVREYVREKEQEEGPPWKLAGGQKPLSDGQLWRYLGRVDRLIAESCRASRKKLLRRHLAQRRNLFAKCVAAGDYRAALAAADSEAKLLGLHDDETARELAALRREIEGLKGAQHAGRNGAAEPGGPPAAVGRPEGEPAHPAAATAEGGPEPPAHGRRPDAGRMADGPTPLF